MFKMRCFGVVAVTMTLVGSVATAGTVLYVDDDADPGGDGLSWDTAYKYLQDALDSAVDGTEIRVGQGTYLPDRDEGNPDGTGDREATFLLMNDVAIMGGYAGLGEKDPDERNIALFETTLSGDLNGDDAPDFVDTGENAYLLRKAGSHRVITEHDGPPEIEHAIMAAIQDRANGTRLHGDDTILREWTTEHQMEQLLDALAC